ncbi:ATP-binding protein [Kitasatospora sp. NPDC101176]|uniref:ATP-binding protein n=1 Tax=Kitasatospora sp. NPDC101176 TaxID=3364099 RepID=UPI00380D8426
MTTTLELATGTAEVPSPAPPGPATLRLPYAAESAAAARRLVRAKLTEWELPDLVDDALLIISELVANAVGTGCQTHMVVAIRRPTDRTVRLLVSDGSASLPVRIDAGPDAESGRGLDLVHKLTNAKWGVQLWPRGKVVHADLPTTHAWRCSEGSKAGPSA